MTVDEFRNNKEWVAELSDFLDTCGGAAFISALMSTSPHHGVGSVSHENTSQCIAHVAFQSRHNTMMKTIADMATVSEKKKPKIPYKS